MQSRKEVADRPQDAATSNESFQRHRTVLFNGPRGIRRIERVAAPQMPFAQLNETVSNFGDLARYWLDPIARPGALHLCEWRTRDGENRVRRSALRLPRKKANRCSGLSPPSVMSFPVFFAIEFAYGRLKDSRLSDINPCNDEYAIFSKSFAILDKTCLFVLVA